ncbi:hypothetical protein ACE6H2_015100 [Prunus campanulata]
MKSNDRYLVEFKIGAERNYQSTLFDLILLFFYKPNLWWPNGMGKSLYKVSITVDVKGYGESFLEPIIWIPKIESHIDNTTGGRYDCGVGSGKRRQYNNNNKKVEPLVQH